MIILQIIGLVLIAITYWINKYTYKVKVSRNWSTSKREYTYTKMKSPLWVWLLVIILNIILPFIIIAVFIIGLIGYIVNCQEGDIVPKYNPESKYCKCWNKIKVFLNKDV